MMLALGTSTPTSITVVATNTCVQLAVKSAITSALSLLFILPWTKPTLIGAKSFINKGGANTFFEAQKKKEDVKWLTVKVGKTKSKNAHLYLLDGGYKELRQIQGRQTAEIDLQYSFELAKSGLTTKIGSGVYQVKFANLLSQNKGRGFEERRGKKVFYASNEEQKKAMSFVGKKIVGELKKALGNV